MTLPTTIAALKADYERFPADQTYSLYTPDVYFKDPMTEFCGVDRYRAMISFIQTWFLNCQMELHQIEQIDNHIKTEWTLRWTSPLPWKPQTAIRGWSDLTLNGDGLIVSHVDYWHTPKWQVLAQQFGWGQRNG
jgi:hypothetical protein